MKTPRLLLMLLFMAGAMQGQDADWVRTWSEAQRHRPRAIPSVARIAPPSEPGTPLIVHGRLYQRDGKTPAAGVVVFAYHTDAKGLYNPRGTPGWRLRGWAKTDANGRFEFRTMRPASYPSSRIAAHIHFTIDGPDLPRRWTPELNFLDDPFVSQREKRKSAEGGRFGFVRAVTAGNGVQHVDFELQIADEGKF